MYHPHNSIIETQANITMYRKAIAGCELELNARAGENWKDRDDLIADECEVIRRTYRAWKQARNGVDTMLERLGELKAQEQAD